MVGLCLESQNVRVDALVFSPKKLSLSDPFGIEIKERRSSRSYLIRRKSKYRRMCITLRSDPLFYVKIVACSDTQP